MPEPEIDTELIDEAVLALLFLTLHKDRKRCFAPTLFCLATEADQRGHGR
jgi:hypothetical protein